LEYAKDYSFYENLKERGLNSPLDELEPIKDDLVLWFLDTFKVLESSRQPNGSIPVSEILVFSDYFDLMCPLDQYLRTIVAMDAEVIEYQMEQRKKDDRRRKSKR
jgi:hypothetical protein